MPSCGPIMDKIKEESMVTEKKDKQDVNNHCNQINTHAAIIFSNETSQCFLAG